VRLYRPFKAQAFVDALPASVKALAVLDRTKEPGSLGEPLYEDVQTALAETGRSVSVVVGGRYGLGSKEFTPAMVKAVFENLDGEKKNHFSVGINDDVLGQSLAYDTSWTLEEEGTNEAMFYGLGSDGTVGANKNSIKIIGDARPELNAQAYFSYDSKKSGGFTVSHLRFGKKPIRRPYLITSADFVACHKFTYMETYHMLETAKTGASFLLNSPYDAKTVWSHIPVEQQQAIIDKKMQFYVIDAFKIAEKAGMGNRINVVMQAAYFKISGVLPEAEAVEYMKKFIEKSYGKKGADVVQKNIATSFIFHASKETVEQLRKDYDESNIVSNVVHTGVRKQKMLDFMAHFQFMMYTFSSLGVIMCFIVIYNSYIISIAERNRELSSLLVLGMSRKEVAQIIALEQQIIAFFGVLFGLPLTKVLLKYVSVALSDDNFSIPTTIIPSKFAISLLCIVLSMVLAQYSGRKKINELVIVEVLKERE